MRAIATAVDWPCEVHTLFREHNLGCKQGVAQGITWFFEHEPEGIVLEDDVLPLPGFFAYCEDLLARYRHEERVAAISGCNLAADRYQPPASYCFTRQNHVWGWASWRRAWRHYDIDLAGFADWDARGGLVDWLEGDTCAAHYWRGIFGRMQRCEIDTWDYQWMASCWMHGGLTALPARNLTTNLGLGPGVEATHTSKGVPRHVRDNPAHELDRPLRHPPAVTRDAEADRAIQRHVIGLGHWRCARRAVARALKRLAGQDRR